MTQTSISTVLETEYGNFTLNYHEFAGQQCVSLSKGDIAKGEPLIRIHSSCLFSEALCAIDCDCKLQLNKSLQYISEERKGVLVYLYQEGRGVGLANKIQAVEMMRTEECDTATAFQKLGFALDPRDYSLAITALKELDVSKTLRLMSNNPRKSNALRKAGYKIKEHVALSYETNETVVRYLKSKEDKLGHTIPWHAIRVASALKGGSIDVE